MSDINIDKNFGMLALLKCSYRNLLNPLWYPSDQVLHPKLLNLLLKNEVSVK